jgi:pyridoxal phosphate phosphatase PHOSPHO2
MCNPNICKGTELDGWIKENGGWNAFERVSYVGDGKNDFCPMVRLRKGDWAMVRKDLGLDLMLKEGKEAELQADVKRWEGAWEVDELFQAL